MASAAAWRRLAATWLLRRIWPGSEPRLKQGAPHGCALASPCASRAARASITARPPRCAHIKTDRRVVPASRSFAANVDKSTRWIVQPAALAVLEQVFAMDQFPTRQLRASLATNLAVNPRQV